MLNYWAKSRRGFGVSCEGVGFHTLRRESFSSPKDLADRLLAAIT